jgi:hypothetical protein
MTAADPRYSELAAIGPYAPAIGGALITMVQPNPGHEIAYNRWYEDDHFYAGALAMPWMFAGRRWVALASHRAARHPATSAVAQPVTDGRYISLYWITEGRMADHIAWTTSTNKRLRADGRGFEQRTHIFTTFADYLGPVYRSDEGPRDIHALDHRYDGLVVEIVDALSVDSVDALDHWLAHDHVPALHRAHGGVGQSLRFRPQPLPRTFNDVVDVSGIEQRLVLLHFLNGDPLERWDDTFATHGRSIDSSALGTLQFCAPFIPTEVGTNRYVFDD